MRNQSGQLRPPAADEIKFLDNNNDKTAKHSFLSECFAALSSLSKISISSAVGDLASCPINSTSTHHIMSLYFAYTIKPLKTNSI